MKRYIKPGIVLAGYAAALLIACTAVYFRQLATQGPEADASSGMYAFGDMLLFLTVLVGLALIPTALALYFFRSVPKFWAVLANSALAFAALGIVWLGAVELSWPKGARPDPDSMLSVLAAFGMLRVFAAPLLAVLCLICAAVAPAPRWRWRLGAAAVLECALVALFFVWI